MVHSVPRHAGYLGQPPEVGIIKLNVDAALPANMDYLVLSMVALAILWVGAFGENGSRFTSVLK